MRRLVWLAGLLGALALALLLGLRSQAVAAEASPGDTCSPAEGFIPAFCLNVPTSSERRETTVPLISLPTERADVRVETTIPAADAAALAAGTDLAVARVETLFGRNFSARPRVLLFGTVDSFSQGARDLFGYSRETADHVANTYGGIFDRTTLTIAVNFSASSRERMQAAIAHELTHLMIRDLTGGNDVPTWFDEGLATLVEQQDPSGAIWTEDEELTGWAVAASGSVSLDDVVALNDWHTTYARVGRPLYTLAADAVRTIETRIGWSGVVDLITDIGRGTRFDAAYFSASHESTAILGRRLAETARPAIAVTAGADHSVLWTLFAGTANAPVTVTITGPDSYTVTFSAQTDVYGMYRGSFGGGTTPGLYTVRAAGVSAALVTTR